MMTKKEQKRNFTLRLSEDVHKKIEKQASELGLSKNAFISMIIHKTVNNK